MLNQEDSTSQKYTKMVHRGDRFVAQFSTSQIELENSLMNIPKGIRCISLFLLSSNLYSLKSQLEYNCVNNCKICICTDFMFFV